MFRSQSRNEGDTAISVTAVKRLGILEVPSVEAAGRPSFDTSIARRRIAAYSLGGGSFLVAIILLVAAWAIIQGRITAHRAAEVATTNLAHILADNFENTIEKIDFGLRAIVDELARQRDLGIVHDQEMIDTIARQDSRNMDSAGFRVYGPDGNLRYGLTNVIVRDANVSQLGPFQFLRDNPSAGFLVSPPLFGTVLQQWVIPASRRIDDRQGHFDGVVASGVPTRTIVRAFSALNVGPGGIVALYHNDYQMAARYPDIPGSESPIGKTIINDQFRAIIAAGIAEAQIDYKSAVDGTRRTGHAIRIAGLPYYIVVAFAEDDYLADWRTIL